MNNNELKRNFRQAARIFLLSTVIAFAVALLTYAVVILFSEPEPVNETISGTTDGALAKV
jgi:heme/copper-type cytochrome/quinol oxidase subunit 3